MNSTTFKYVTLELVEKIFRLRSYITKNNSKNDNNCNMAVINIFEKSISSLLYNIEKLIIEINKIDKDTTSNEFFAIQRSLNLCYLTIKELHKELNFLSTDWLKLETFTFVEQLYEKHFHPFDSKEINIILSDDYTFIETNLDKKFERIMDAFFEQTNTYLSEESPTIIIPKIEYSNPLNWTIIVHELGHTEKEDLMNFSKNLIFPDSISESEKKILLNWAEEIYCDIKAIQIIGPAYFMSLASFAILQSLVSGSSFSSGSHPPFKMRLALLFSYIDKNNLILTIKLPNQKSGTIHSFIYEMTKIVDDNLINFNEMLVRDSSIEDIMIFYNHIKGVLIKNENKPKNIAPVFELVEDLNRLIPVGSYRSRINDKIYIEKLDKVELSKIEFDQIKDSITERYAELWEIINAGWVYKIQKIIPFGFNLFFDSSEFNIREKVEKYSEKLELLDDRMLVSIEISKLIDLIEN